MPRKSEPVRSIGNESSVTPKKSTAAPKKKRNCCDKKTLFLATTMIESSYQTTVRCAPIDEQRFKETYTALKNLYEVLD
jgi:hypothetical protein